MNSPFHVKEYTSYDDYIVQQVSKLDNGLVEKNWFKRYEIKYPKLLNYLLKKSSLSFIGTSVLCIGARTGSEVKTFCQLGAFAVGIDVNTGKNNKWVVTGDASSIQYPNHCVDIVYTNVLDHLLKIDECLAETKRVLKSNGYMILLIGSPEDAQKDKWGSTYWDNIDDVVTYLKEMYGLIVKKRIDVKFTNWFSDFIVFKNETICEQL